MNPVDTYISKFNPETQRRLEIIRAAGFQTFDDPEERIYFAMPTFSAGGKDVLHYAAYKNHISLIVGYEIIPLLMATHPNYSYTKATIQLPHADPFPEELIREICAMANHFYPQ